MTEHERALETSPHPLTRGGRAAAGLSTPGGPAASFTDRPFGCPLDTVLDVPVPPSVNRTRGFSGSGLGKVRKWYERAGLTLIGNGQFRKAQKNISRFELVIVLCEKQCRMDLDNAAKAAIDFLRHINIIKNDGPAQMRKVTLQWGEAPEGCRLIVKPIEGGI